MPALVGASHVAPPVAMISRKVIPVKLTVPDALLIVAGVPLVAERRMLFVSVTVVTVVVWDAGSSSTPVEAWIVPRTRLEPESVKVPAELMTVRLALFGLLKVRVAAVVNSIIEFAPKVPPMMSLVPVPVTTILPPLIFMVGKLTSNVPRVIDPTVSV